MTPSWRQTLRCINYRIGESSTSLFLHMVNLYLIIFEAWWICLKMNHDLEKNKSAWWIFIQLNFQGDEYLPNCYGKEVNWWSILTQRFWWKGEQRWTLEEGRFKMQIDARIETHAPTNAYPAMCNMQKLKTAKGPFFSSNLIQKSRQRHFGPLFVTFLYVWLHIPPIKLTSLKHRNLHIT